MRMRESVQMRMREDLLLGALAIILINGGVGHFTGVLQDSYGFACHVKVIKSFA